jgi:2-polyprenyl-3-methyl-5-hydroxy-6-metoxy-1,4-benzoquinol methylase
MARAIGGDVAGLIKKYGQIDEQSPFHLLDVGCATGFLMHALESFFPNMLPQGVEPSPVSVKKAQLLYGLKVHQGTMNTFDSGGLRFEVATIMGNLQLHENPFATLTQVYAVLKPGGLLIFQMKNPFCTARRLARIAAKIPWVNRTSLTRLMLERGYFCMRYSASKRLLKAAAQKIGFEVLDVATHPPRMLAFTNQNVAHAKGIKGKVWGALDTIDKLMGQRAWIQICCLKPKANSTSA